MHEEHEKYCGCDMQLHLYTASKVLSQLSLFLLVFNFCISTTELQPDNLLGYRLLNKQLIFHNKSMYITAFNIKIIYLHVR